MKRKGRDFRLGPEEFAESAISRGEISISELVEMIPQYVHLAEAHAESNSSQRDWKFSSNSFATRNAQDTKTNFIYKSYAPDVPGDFKITRKGLVFEKEYFRS